MDARRRVALVALVVLALAAAAEGYNITKILGEYPEYSQFNKLLTQTRLAQDINKRRTITVLVVANGDMGSLTGGGRTLQTIRHMLQIHVLVDYYGGKKLHQLAHGVTACSSMFQVPYQAITGRPPSSLLTAGQLPAPLLLVPALTTRRVADRWTQAPPAGELCFPPSSSQLRDGEADRWGHAILLSVTTVREPEIKGVILSAPSIRLDSVFSFEP